MLAAMRSRMWGRGKQADTEPAPVARPKTRSRSPEDSLLLLVPSEGGMSFRLFSVENEGAATAFLQQEFPRLGGKSLAFWPLKAKPQASAGQAAEALVLISDPSRPGTVYLSSFETMEDAESFMRFETENGLDPDLITTYWGMPKTIDATIQPHSSAENFPAAAAASPIQAQPVVPPAVARASMSMPASAVAVSTARQPAPVRNAPSAQAAPADVQRPGLFESMRAWPGWETLRERVTAAAMLKWEVYEEIKKDPIASTQARVIVAAGAVAAGIGAFWAGPLAIIAYVVAGLLGWLAFAFLTYWVGTTVFPGRRSDESWGLLFKALGIAHAPKVLMLSGLALPLFSPLIALALFIWVLGAAVPATQYALELDRESSILTAITGALALFAISLMIPALII
jgi:hypothetical protein